MLGEFGRVPAGGGEDAGFGHTSELLQETVWYVVVVVVYAAGILSAQCCSFVKLESLFQFDYFCVPCRKLVMLFVSCHERYACLSVSLSVCDVLPLIINNMEMRLPASLLHKYMHKAAEFYIGYVTRGPCADAQIPGG